LAALGLIPAPDRCYVEGFVDPVQYAVIHAGADGFLADHFPSGKAVSPDGAPLVRCINPGLDAELRQYEADRRGLMARRSLAQTKDMAAVQIVEEQIRATDEKIQRVRTQLADLEIRAPFAGTWLSPQIDRRRGAYIRRGDEVGRVATLGNVLIRAVAGQDVVGLLVVEANQRVEMRPDRRPDTTLTGTIRQFLPAGQDRLPSPALGYAGGGSLAVSSDDPRGTKTPERFFEIQVKPDPDSAGQLLAGQRVIIRFEAESKPYLAQWWRGLLQLFQRRFQV
jgi:putative peptide zinc metalloprotease protein